MRGIRFGSAACDRAFSAWESSRNEPPDDEDECEATASVDEFLNVYASKAHKSSTEMTYNPNSESGFDLKYVATSWWAKCSKRGQAYTEALREAYPSAFQDLRVADSEAMIRYAGSWMYPTTWAVSLKKRYSDAVALMKKLDIKPCKFITHGYSLANGWQFTRVSYGSVTVSCRTSAEYQTEG